MMRLILTTIVFVFTSMASADDSAERAVVQDLAANLFADDKYSDLEKLAANFRDNRSKISSGTWKLPEFYKGVTEKGVLSASASQNEWEDSFKKLDIWIAAYPDSPTPYVAKAGALINRGWAIRGRGRASGVAKQDMEEYYKYVVAGAQYLTETVDVGSPDPHWYYLLANVYKSMGVEKENYLALVEEGLDWHPHYDPLYFNSSGYFSPKWHGSFAELEEFARASLDRTIATRGYELYARIYWAAGMTSTRKYAFQSPLANWKDFVKGMDEVIKRYPSQWNRSGPQKSDSAIRWNPAG